MDKATLLQRVNQILEKDTTHRTFIRTIEDLVVIVEQQQKEIKQYQLQESLLLERLKKMTLEYKELKKSSRTIRYFEMAEENLKLAEANAKLVEELALLKGELSG